MSWRGRRCSQTPPSRPPSPWRHRGRPGWIGGGARCPGVSAHGRHAPRCRRRTARTRDWPDGRGARSIQIVSARPARLGDTWARATVADARPCRVDARLAARRERAACVCASAAGGESPLARGGKRDTAERRHLEPPKRNSHGARSAIPCTATGRAGAAQIGVPRKKLQSVEIGVIGSLGHWGRPYRNRGSDCGPRWRSELSSLDIYSLNWSAAYSLRAVAQLAASGAGCGACSAGDCTWSLPHGVPWARAERA